MAKERVARQLKCLFEQAIGEFYDTSSNRKGTIFVEKIVVSSTNINTAVIVFVSKSKQLMVSFFRF